MDADDSSDFRPSSGSPPGLFASFSPPNNSRRANLFRLGGVVVCLPLVSFARVETCMRRRRSADGSSSSLLNHIGSCFPRAGLSLCTSARAASAASATFEKPYFSESSFIISAVHCTSTTFIYQISPGRESTRLALERKNSRFFSNCLLEHAHPIVAEKLDTSRPIRAISVVITRQHSRGGALARWRRKRKSRLLLSRRRRQHKH